MNPIKVQITKKDIQDGWQWSFARLVSGPKPWLIDTRHQHCPVAIALKRAFKFKGVSSGSYRIESKGKQYRTPEAVSDWMCNFDYGLPVEPFEFEITEAMRIKPDSRFSDELVVN